MVANDLKVVQNFIKDKNIRETKNKIYTNE